MRKALLLLKDIAGPSTCSARQLIPDGQFALCSHCVVLSCILWIAVLSASILAWLGLCEMWIVAVRWIGAHIG